MSERGSYCTENMYCQECAEAAFEALSEAGLNPQEVAGKRIIAGVYRRMPGSSGEEIWDFELRVSPMIAKRICHEIRVAVMADCGQSALYKILPKTKALDEHIELIESKGGYWTSE